eukprot:scaffold35520_cov18-Tisochrysis_lutea.AAC.2
MCKACGTVHLCGMGTAYERKGKCALGQGIASGIYFTARALGKAAPKEQSSLSEIEATLIEATFLTNGSQRNKLQFLGQISQATSSYAPNNSSRQPSHSVLSEGPGMAGSHYQPTYDSPEKEKLQRALQRQQQRQDAERQGTLARSLSDTGSSSNQPRESFAFPTPGGSGSKPPRDTSPPMHEARLSQANVQQLQRQFEDGQYGSVSNEGASDQEAALWAAENK